MPVSLQNQSVISVPTLTLAMDPTYIVGVLYQLDDLIWDAVFPQDVPQAWSVDAVKDGFEVHKFR